MASIAVSDGTSDNNEQSTNYGTPARVLWDYVPRYELASESDLHDFVNNRIAEVEQRLEKKIEKLEKQNAQFEAQIGNLMENNQDLKQVEQENKSQQDIVSTLKTELYKQKCIERELKEKLSCRTRELQEAQGRLAQLNNDLATKTSLVDDLKRQLQIADSEKATSNSEAEELREKLRATEASLRIRSITDAYQVMENKMQEETNVTQKLEEHKVIREHDKQINNLNNTVTSSVEERFKFKQRKSADGDSSTGSRGAEQSRSEKVTLSSLKHLKRSKSLDANCQAGYEAEEKNTKLVIKCEFHHHI